MSNERGEKMKHTTKIITAKRTEKTNMTIQKKAQSKNEARMQNL
jgi:hypothetical protein